MTFISHAQNFEDVILWRALRHVRDGFYIDIGAHDPVIDSVSFAFYKKGWRGAHVEPVSHFANKLRDARPDEQVIEAAVSRNEEKLPFFEVDETGLSTGDEGLARKYEKDGHTVKRITVPGLPLSAILDAYRSREIHWLKIDVEGIEDQIIASWSPSPIRPWIVLIKSTRPNSMASSREVWEPALLMLGYEFVYFDGLNRFYLHNEHHEIREKFGAGPNYFDDFSLTQFSPFASQLHRQISVATEDVAELNQRLAEMEDMRRIAIVREAALNRRFMLLNRHVARLEKQTADIYESFSWRIASQLRFFGRKTIWLAYEIRAWATLKPGSRPRQFIRAAVVGAIGKVLERPHLARIAKRFASRFPQVNSRLRMMAYNKRSMMNFMLTRAAPEAGTLDLYMEPQLVRLTYRRLMRARTNMAHVPHFSRFTDETLPRLAFLSSFFPGQSRTAEHNADLLLELARYYSIDVVLREPGASPLGIEEHYTIRDLAWFERYANTYDRIVYDFGNSESYGYMPDLLVKFPGVIVLHNFYPREEATDLRANERAARELYHSHGYRALREGLDSDPISAMVAQYPANLSVLENAQGVIVHNDYSRQLAARHYGENLARDLAVAPLPRALPHTNARDEARVALQFNQNDFVVCVFGSLPAARHCLLQTWLETPLLNDKCCHLIFVGGEGENRQHSEDFCEILNVSPGSNVRITKYASSELSEKYVQAADIAVQLANRSDEEAVMTVLDCLAHGICTIVAPQGSLVEFPRSSVITLTDEYSTTELAAVIVSLRNDPARRQALISEGLRYITNHHFPSGVAGKYYEIIERFAALAPPAFDARALGEHASLVSTPPDDEAWVTLAQELAREATVRKSCVRQLLVDVSILAREDFKTGIQRVVRAQLLALLNDPPAGFRVEPVWLVEAHGQWHYRYARRYVLNLLGLPGELLEDDPVEIYANDLFYMPDYWTDGVVHATDAGLYAEWRAIGVKTSFMVYDILPLLRPDCFPDRFTEMHAKWLLHLADSADQLICISHAVAEETEAWLRANKPEALQHLEIAAVHLGADIAASAPSKGLPDDAHSVLELLASRLSFLMVGTVEPRKGYLQTLKAFESLWNAGIDVNLVIVGAEGWKGLPHQQRRTIPEIVEKLRHHPELGKRLFWLEGVSDEYLEKIYGSCVCLIASSEAEGFGLPLIEAARHAIPILTRDIPVFREVAGSHAFYFVGDTPDDLSHAIRDWLKLYADNVHPTSNNMNWLTWAENVERLKKVLLRES